LGPLGDLAEPYLALCKRMSALAAARTGKTDGVAAKAAAIRKDVADLAAKAGDAQAKDTTARLTAAAEYLEQYTPQPGSQQ
ncbi:hypothetical protein LCGC14_2019830, partial [marine sediment metagenome]